MTRLFTTQKFDPFDKLGVNLVSEMLTSEEPDQTIQSKCYIL